MNLFPKILAWELWRKNRWGILAIFAAFFFGWLLRYGLFPFTTLAVEPVIGIFILLIAFCYTALLAIFGFAEADATGNFGFPTRLFAMPLSTSKLVTCLVCLGAMTSALVSLGWLALLGTIGGDRFPKCYAALLAANGVVMFQALVWTLPHFPKIRAIALLSLAAILLGLVPLPLQTYWVDIEDRILLAMTASLSAAYAFAVVGVRRIRAGGLSSWEFGAKVIDRIASRLPFLQAAFGSPALAQFWIEWRRNGRLPIVLFGLGMVLIAVPFLRAVHRGGSGIELFLLYLVVLLSPAVLTAVFAGLKVANDCRSGDYSISGFMASQPLATSEIFIAKLNVLVTIILIILAGLGLGLLGASKLCFGMWITPEAWERLRQESPHFILLLTAGVALTWNFAVGGLPLWLSGRVPGLPWSMLIWLAAAIGVTRVGLYFYENPLLRIVLYCMLVGGVAWKLVIAAWGFQRDYTKRLLSMRVIWIYSSCWLVATVGLVLLVRLICSGTTLPLLLVELLAALAFPLARIAISPLALDWNRHR